jgi:hypothetical protein
MSLREVFRELSSRHSLVEMHKELMSLLQEEYAMLKEFFEPKRKKPQPQPQEPQEPQPQEPQQPQQPQPKPQAQDTPVKVLANTKIRIIKASDLIEAAAPAPAPAPAPPQETTRMNSKDLKQWQKDQEAKKLKELTTQGILPETLLTKENIVKWIKDEQRTFAFVAREYVGMPEAKVAEFAKEHGVSSSISKKRAILSAKNRAL